MIHIYISVYTIYVYIYNIYIYIYIQQFAGANKRRKLNNPVREQAKNLFLYRKPRCPFNKLRQCSECLNI